MRKLRYAIHTFVLFIVSLVSFLVSLVLLPVELVGLLLTHGSRLITSALGASVRAVQAYRDASFARSVEPDEFEVTATIGEVEPITEKPE